jgi:hypothetical protein
MQKKVEQHSLLPQLQPNNCDDLRTERSETDVDNENNDDSLYLLSRYNYYLPKWWQRERIRDFGGDCCQTMPQMMDGGVMMVISALNLLQQLPTTWLLRYYRL